MEKIRNKKIKVLVTGGAGFLGREVVRQLSSLGYFVRVTDLLKRPKNFQADEYIRGDLTKIRTIDRSFKGITYCIHLAAKTGGIGFYHKYPATILYENNKLYTSVFEASVKFKIKRFVYASSSMVYGSTEESPLLESDMGKYPVPQSAYAFSKLIGEFYCRYYYEEFGLPFTICRLFNIYGPLPKEGVKFSHVIPDLINKITRGQYPVEIWGDGSQRRCFTHIEDTARGIILAMKSSKAKNEDFNFGSNYEIKILELAELIFKNCYPNKKFKYKLRKGPKMDVKRQIPVYNKAKKILDWEPNKKFEFELPIIVKEFIRSLNK